MDYFVHALAIRRWADEREARFALPHVVRRLVLATVDGNPKVDFPAYESVHRAGYDGVVVCSNGNAWVPEGRSAWELGVNKDVKRKADREFLNRTREASSEEQKKTCFIFVTPRHWKNKKAWASEQKDHGDWKDVRAYDSDDLEQWLETAPIGTIAWIGRRMGVRCDGVDDIESRWEAISKSATRDLLPSVFLAGRDQSLERVKQWLVKPPDRLAIECRSPLEVTDFFCAAIAAMDEPERTVRASRAVIVESQNAWRFLRDAETPAILVVDPSLVLPSEDVARAVSKGHHVLVAIQPAKVTERPETELERANQFELMKALEDCGYEPVKTQQVARAAGGSLAILKHHLARYKSSITPDWAADANAKVVAACLLLGGWNDANECDLAAFGRIAGRPYADCETALQGLATCRDPLLLHAAGNWRLISKDHAWSLLQDRVTTSALREFEPLAIEILAEEHLQPHIAKHSETIKRHVAETLAFLGEFGSELEAASSVDVTSAIDRIVANVLPPTCTWHRWASLGSRLPLLAEASPASFLRAVREDLDKSEPELIKLLHEEDETLFGRCNHAGLLWAMEGLAWSKQYFGEVAELLLSLAARDPGGRWSNRPKNSLCEILSYWIPHTTASVEDRIQAIDLLIRGGNREAAWSILLDLLPDATGGVSTPTQTPYWRSWANEWQRGVTRQESVRFITATAQQVIQLAGLDSSRWKSLFEHVGRLPYTIRDRFLEAAHSLCQTEIPDTERRSLSEELAKQIHRHRCFKDAGWSLPADMLDELDKILQKLKPQSSVMRNAWLFEDWPERYFERGGEAADNQAALDNARQSAVREILQAEGFAGIEALVEHAKSPSEVGRAVSITMGDEFLAALIPTKLEGDRRDIDFAAGFIWNRSDQDGWQWIDSALSLCSTNNSKANFLATLRFMPAVWNRAKEAGDEVSRLYWSRCRAFNPPLDSEQTTAAVQALVAHGRPGHAINLLSMALHKKRELDAKTLLMPLESLLCMPADEANDQRRPVDAHGIQAVIETLQNRDDVDPERLMRVEWGYIRLLDEHSGHSPRTLEKHLSSSPEFFNKLLSLCYRSRDDDATEERPEPTEYDRCMAEHAFDLLHYWKRVPGTMEDGPIDEAILRNWCNEARRIAKASGRLEVCDNYIGEVFAKCKKADGDGTWPCSAIRNVAEEIARESDSLCSGMLCGILNLRGAVWRGPGGDQERQLAETYRARAERIRIRAPRMARVLDSVVQSYESEAKRWDEQERWEE